MLRSKKLQRIFAEFIDVIAGVLADEVQPNKEFLHDYLTYPRPSLDGSKITNGEHPGYNLYYPEREPTTKIALSVFDQAKYTVKKIQQKVKEENEINDFETESHRKINAAFKHKIKKQTLDRIKKQKDKEDKPKILLTPIQQEMLDHVETVIAQMESLDNNNKELREDVKDIEKDLTDFKAKK